METSHWLVLLGLIVVGNLIAVYLAETVRLNAAAAPAPAG